MAKQTNPFHGDDDADDVFQKHDNEKSKKSLTSYGDSETPISSTSDQNESGFSDVVSGDANNILPVVKLSSTQKAQLSAPYKHSLFAKVLGKRVGDQKLTTHLRRLWSPEGELVIVPLENGFYSLRFSLSSDYNKVFEGVPWLIDDHYITLRPWIPNFKPSETMIGKTAVWIRLPGLPIEYYDKKVLKQIGKAIGNFVRIDSVTEQQTKGRFARLCVEIDLNRPLRPGIELDGLFQRIEYEGLHLICYHCGRVGHRQQDCSFLPPVGTNRTHYHLSSSELSATQEMANTSSQNLTSNNNSPSSSIYGNWLQVPPRRGQRPRHLARDSGQKQPQVPNSNTVAIRSEAPQMGSRFRVLEEEENPVDVHKSREEKSSISVSVSSPPDHTKMNATLERNRQLQPGEGTSSPAKNMETSTEAKDMPLNPETVEASTGHHDTSFKPEVWPGFSSSTSPEPNPPNALAPSPTSCHSNVSTSSLDNHPKPSKHQAVSPSPPASLVTASTSTEPLSYQPTDSVMTNPLPTASTSLHLNQPHRPNALAPSPTSCHSNISTSSVDNHPKPSKHQAVSPSPPASLVTASTSTEPLSYQPTDSVITNPLPTASTSLHLNQPQPSATAIEFYSQGVQRSTQQLEVTDTPVELSTEGSPTVVSFDSRISSIDIGLNIFPLYNGMTNQHLINFIPSSVDHTNYNVPQTCPKKIFTWNCRGAGDAKFKRAMKDICNLHRLSMAILFETRIYGTDADQVIKDTGFSGSFWVDPTVFTGGFWLLWCKDDVEIEYINPIDSQKIHVAVQFRHEPRDAILYGVDVAAAAYIDESSDLRLFGVDSDSDPLSQPQSPDFGHNSEHLAFPPSSQWISSY